MPFSMKSMGYRSPRDMEMAKRDKICPVMSRALWRDKPCPAVSRDGS